MAYLRSSKFGTAALEIKIKQLINNKNQIWFEELMKSDETWEILIESYET